MLELVAAGRQAAVAGSPIIVGSGLIAIGVGLVAHACPQVDRDAGPLTFDRLALQPIA